MSGEPLDQLLNFVDPEASQLNNLPDRIWVLGGKCDPSHYPSASLRDAFWRYTISPSASFPWLKSLERPEDCEGWWAFSGYDDLLEFERDACYLARAVVLFAESPGSHAELGALALDDAILSRLLVVVQSKYLDEDTRTSYLNLGPLKRVRERGGQCVIGTVLPKTLPTEDIEVITERLGSWLPVTHNREALRPNDPTHRLLLLADIIDLLGVSKLADLAKALSYFGIEINERQLKRAVNLLNFFGLIRIEVRGDEPFFVRRLDSDGPWVNYKAKNPGERFDRARAKVEYQKFIEGDARRRSILERVR